MKIGLGQIDMGFEEKEAAMHLCSHLLAEANQKAVDLVVFPEMTLTGFTMNPQEFGEERAQSQTIAFFQEEARKNSVAICFGLPVHENGVSTNHCIVVDENGTLLADYAKIHPFSYGAEAKHYIGGEEIQFCQIKGVSLTPFICYDLRFPEIFQIASEKSRIITVIANWPTSRREHWMTLLQARAIENQCFLIGVNRTGNGGGLSYNGDSMLISPSGEIISHIEKDSGLFTAEIDLAAVSSLRESFPLKADRKPALYYALWQAQHRK